MSAPLRVLHLTRDFPPRSRGGLSTAVGGLVRAGRSVGIDSAVLSFDDWRPLAKRPSMAEPGAAPTRDERDDVAVLRLTQVEQREALAPFARAFRPDLLLVHDALLFGEARTLRQQLGLRSVYAAHVLHGALCELRGLDQPTAGVLAEREALAESERVLAPSDFAAEHLRRAAPTIDPRLFVTPLGTGDTPAAKVSWERRQRQPRVDARPTLLYVGRFADVNGTQQLLEALPGLCARHPELRVVIAGGIPANEKGERRWRRRFDGLGLAERLVLTGWLDRAALAEQLSTATLLVSPSWLETFGLVVLEAMCFGVPVVACAGHAVDALVTPDETGWLCPPRQVEALGETIEDALADPERARHFGLTGALRARQRWLWPDVVTTWRAALGEHRPG